MIAVTDLVARDRATKASVGPVSFTLDAPGSYALVGTPADGVALLLSLFAGALVPRKGTVTVAGAAPSRRVDVAHVPYTPVLPLEAKVERYLALAAEVRGVPTPSPRERLGSVGVADLASRRIGQLAREEQRTVALVEALTSGAKYLLLEEPRVDLDPRAVGRVSPLLEALAGSATVVLSTASSTDAHALASAQLYFARGLLTRRTTRDEGWKPAEGGLGTQLFLRSEGARLLLAELAVDPTFDEVRGQGAELVVTGKDPLAMAAAVARATRHANVELDLMVFETDAARTERTA